MAEISSQYTVAGGPYYWAGALANPKWKLLGRLPAYMQGWVLYLAFVAGITSYEFQIAQQLTTIRLILSNSKLGTPPGALGDISSVSFGVAVPNHPDPRFQQAFYGIMIGFLVFHGELPACRLLPGLHCPRTAATACLPPAAGAALPAAACLALALQFAC